MYSSLLRDDMVTQIFIKSNLFQLVEQFNQLPGGDSVFYPSEHENKSQSQHNPSFAVENNNSDRIDASLAEQYYRYNLQLAETRGSGPTPLYLPPSSVAAAGGPIQYSDNSVNAQLLSKSQLGGAAPPLSGKNTSSILPTGKNSEDRRKKVKSTMSTVVIEKQDSKSSQKLESKKHSIGQVKGSQSDHNLRRTSPSVAPRGSTSRRAVSPASTPANTTIPSGQRHYRSIAIAGTNNQRKVTPPRDRRANTGSNHHMESDSISKNTDKRTSSGSQRKGTTPQRGRGTTTSKNNNNNETDSITFTSQNTDKKASKKNRSSSAPSKASMRS